MNSSIPSLPSLRHFPFYIAIDGLTGYLYGKLSQVSPELTATIFAIRTLANTLFYYLVNFAWKGEGLQSQKIFLFTSAGVNFTFLIVLRELNLIGQLFSCLLGLAMIGHLIHRVFYIQEQERRLLERELLIP